MKLSIIIANHNYCDFVGAAIESALGVDWPNKEVIVVDDASTDDSRGIIEGFSGRVTAYFRPKSHQLGAHIFGFEQSNLEVASKLMKANPALVNQTNLFQQTLLLLAVLMQKTNMIQFLEANGASWDTRSAVMAGCVHGRHADRPSVLPSSRGDGRRLG